LMFAALGQYPNLSAYCCKKISRILFGAEAVVLDNLHVFVRDIMLSLKTADVIGAPERATIARSFETQLDVLDVRGMVGMRGVYNYLSAQQNIADIISNSLWTSTWISRSLLPYLPALLQNREFVGVVSCYDSLSQKMKHSFGIKKTGDYIVPMQASIAKKNGNIGHYPDVFNKIMGSIEVPFPGAIFIVAAGILSKAYCSKIKSLGGVAIDIGSSADVWMGVRSRPGMTAELVDRWQL
jgi:hypothetical protein